MLDLSWEALLERFVLRRKSWVIAMPMLAKLRLVRSQARNVRSVIHAPSCQGQKVLARHTKRYTWGIRVVGLQKKNIPSAR